MDSQIDFEDQSPPLGAVIGSVLRRVRRRRWWILLPGVVIAIVSVPVVMSLSDKFESDTTLVVVQQKIAQRFVESTMNNGAAEAFQVISREILSRSQLGKIIEDFGLYKDARARGVSLDRLAERLRDEIQVEPQVATRFGEISSFRIAFRANTPELAQSVTSRLADLFIEENARKRTGQATTTTRFLADQIEAARQRLAKQEEIVRDYKRANLEGLPQQQQALLAAVMDLRARAQATTATLARLQQERNAIQSALGNYIGILRSDRQNLLVRFTSKHPDVAKKDEEIARAERLYTKLQGNSAGGTDEITSGFDGPQLLQLRAQVEANASETENASREQQRISSESLRQQSTLKMTPVREQELAEILRDYDLYKKDYESLLSKQLNAQLSATLEERNEGQQFRLIDPPTLPKAPSSPNRLLLSLGSLAGGLIIGALLALVAEIRTLVFYSETEVRSKYAVPIITAIPFVHTPLEERRRQRRFAWECVVATTMGLAVVAAELYIYRFG